jgi:hypothetical protein
LIGVSTPDLALPENLSHDPARFASEVLGADLWDKQREILSAVANHKRVAVRSCNGSGKMFTAAYVVIWWLVTQPESIVITTAPTAHQVRNILWREIRRIYHSNTALIGGKLSNTSIELDDKHFAVGLSTDQPERFQGFHEGNILFVVDEASGVREGIYEALEGSMTSSNSKVLLIGNPTSLRGTFYDAFHRRRNLWHTIHISAFDTPNLKSEGVKYPTLVIPGWVADAELNWGVDSYQYQVRVLGEFPSSSEDTLIPLKEIEQARGSAPFEWTEREAAIELGVDVARFGSDRTAICVRAGPKVLGIETFQNLDTMQTAGEVTNVGRRYGASLIRVDEIGIGAGVVDRLNEMGEFEVVGVNVSRRAIYTEHFANYRAEMFDGLRKRFHDKQILIPDNAELISQLTSIRYSFTSSGQLRIEEKRDLRSRGEKSPDMADALALAFASSTGESFKFWT